MGIKLGNTFIKKFCMNNIMKMNIEELRNKTLVIDTSIYMYRFLEENALEYNFQKLIDMFNYYNITPLFIFDGRAKECKRQTLNERRRFRKRAEYEYKETAELLETAKTSLDKLYINNKLKEIKKRTIKITAEHKDIVKKIIDANKQCMYLDAPHESDELCARIVMSKQAVGVLTDDMDMFVYGCPYVYRYLDIVNKTIVRYDLKGIMRTLNMSLTEFKELFIISGTDYNMSTHNIFYYYEQFIAYKKNKKYNNDNNDNNKNDKNNSKKPRKTYKNDNIGFYEWLLLNTDSIDDYDKLLEIYFMFDLNNREHDYLKKIDKDIKKKLKDVKNTEENNVNN